MRGHLPDEPGPQTYQRVVGVEHRVESADESVVTDVPDQRRVHPVLAPVRPPDGCENEVGNLRPNRIRHATAVQPAQQDLLARPRRPHPRFAGTPFRWVGRLPLQRQHRVRRVQQFRRRIAGSAETEGLDRALE